MVYLKGISKYYGPPAKRTAAIEAASFHVENGEFVIITGLSGSGKTTLLNLIGGMTLPDAGEILIDGKNIADMGDGRLSAFRADTIGFVFQFRSMISSLNVIENILLPSVFSAGRADRKRAENLLERVGMSEYIKSYSSELSIGQQRRVCTVRAILKSPPLLLCDEPTGDLDAGNESLIMQIIREENMNGTTVIMATHNLALKSFASRSLRIYDGCIREE